MCDYVHSAIPSRLATEGEQLVVHKLPTGSLELASIADVRHDALARREASEGSIWSRLKRRFQDVPGSSYAIPAVCVPSGTHLILKAIPGSVQQKYGLENEEGAVFVETSIEGGTYRALRFNNGAQIRLQELRVGQLVEVLSLAGTHPVLYEREFQMQ